MSGPAEEAVAIVLGTDDAGEWGAWLDGERVAVARNRNHALAKTALVLLATSLVKSKEHVDRLVKQWEEE